MSASDRQAHWQNVYTTKAEREVSWFQDRPSISLEFIEAAKAGQDAAIVDIGGGASRLVDALLEAGYRNLTVLDLSEAALAASQKRIGAQAASVKWLTGDVTTWQPSEHYDIWHDRAAFHFLTEEKDQQAYIACLRSALRNGGQAVIGTFAMNGPERCSGLPVTRYDAASLAALLGPDFGLLADRVEEHRTPWDASQIFQFSRFLFRLPQR
jgi:SAM-dependent methyltransferase